MRRADHARFRVERIDSRFEIFDTVDCTYSLCEPGTSRPDADEQCARLNGVSRKNTDEDSLHRQFTKGGVTPERLQLESDDTGRPSYQPVVTPREQQLIDSYKTWLPPLLEAWADEVARQCGPARRSSWFTHLILKMLKTDELQLKVRGDWWADDAKAYEDIERMQSILWPHPQQDFDTDEILELREMLIVHYLSPDSDPVKAGNFGISERTYRRQLDAAHRLVAYRWI
jgi:hypothetical protein